MIGNLNSKSGPDPLKALEYVKHVGEVKKLIGPMLQTKSGFVQDSMLQSAAEAALKGDFGRAEKLLRSRGIAPDDADMTKFSERQIQDVLTAFELYTNDKKQELEDLRTQKSPPKKIVPPVTPKTVANPIVQTLTNNQQPLNPLVTTTSNVTITTQVNKQPVITNQSKNMPNQNRAPRNKQPQQTIPDGHIETISVTGKKDFEWRKKKDLPNGNIVWVLNNTTTEKITRPQNYTEELKKETHAILGIAEPVQPKTPPPLPRDKALEKHQAELKQKITDLEAKIKNTKSSKEKKDLKSELASVEKDFDLQNAYIKAELAVEKIRQDLQTEKISLASAEAKGIGTEVTKKKKLIKQLEEELKKKESFAELQNATYTFETAEDGSVEKIEAEKVYSEAKEKAIKAGAIPKPVETGPWAEVKREIEELEKQYTASAQAGNQTEANRLGLKLTQKRIEHKTFEIEKGLEDVVKNLSTETDPDQKKILTEAKKVLEERKAHVLVLKQLAEEQTKVFEEKENMMGFDPKRKLRLEQQFNSYETTLAREQDWEKMLTLESTLLDAQYAKKPASEINPLKSELAILKQYEGIRKSNVELFESLGKLKFAHDAETDQSKKILLGDKIQAGIAILENQKEREGLLRNLIKIEKEISEGDLDAEKLQVKKDEIRKTDADLTKNQERQKIFDLRYVLAKAIEQGEAPEKIEAMQAELLLAEREGFQKGLLEKIREPLKPNEKASVEDKARSMGIKATELKQVPGFEKLSYGEQLLALDQMKQFMVGKTIEDTKTIYDQNRAQAGFVGKIWRGWFREYYMAKAEKVALEKNKNMPWKEKAENLTLITDQTKKLNHDVLVNPDGSYTVQYVKAPKFATPEEQQMYGMLNQSASAFAQLPYEWGLETASKAERQEYQKALEIYTNSKMELLGALEQKLGRKVAFAELATVDANIQLLQFNNTHPEVNQLWEIMESKNKWSIFTGAVAQRSSRLAYVGIGYGARRLAKMGAVGAGGAIAGMVVAAIWGGIRAWKRADKAIQTQDITMRKGFKTDEQKLVTLIQNTPDGKNRDELKTQLEQMRKRGVLEKVTFDGVKLEDTRNRLMIDASTWKDNLDRLAEKIKSEQDPVKKEALLAKLRLRIKYVNDRIEGGLVNFGKTKENVVRNGKTKTESRIANQYGLMNSLNNAILLTTAYDQGVEEIMTKNFESFMKDTDKKELFERLSGINAKTKDKRFNYKFNKAVRGVLFAEAAMAAGALMSDGYDHFFGHPDPAPGVGEGEITNPTIVPPIENPPQFDYKDIGPVQFSSKGGIQTVIDIKHALMGVYANEISGGHLDKIPPAYLKIIQGDAKELAKEFDWYRPEEINESVNIIKGSNITFEHGEVVSNSIYNIHHVAEHESLINEDGSLGADTDHGGSGSEDNERYFDYKGNEGSADGGHPIGDEEIQPAGARIEEEDIKPLKSKGLDHLTTDKTNPDDLLKTQPGIKAPSGNPNPPRITSPGVRPGQIYYGNPNPPRITSPGVRYWNFWGANFTPSESTISTLASLDAHDVLNDPSQYGTTGNMGEAIAQIKQVSGELGLEPYKSSLFGNETMEDFTERLNQATQEQVG